MLSGSTHSLAHNQTTAPKSTAQQRHTDWAALLLVSITHSLYSIKYMREMMHKKVRCVYAAVSKKECVSVLVRGRVRKCVCV